jgi:hypothetical protein
MSSKVSPRDAKLGVMVSSLLCEARVQRGVVSSPTPTRPRLSIVAGSLAGVTGSLGWSWSGVVLRCMGPVGSGGTGESERPK